MSIYLFRHAEAHPYGTEGIGSDEERYLTEYGKEMTRWVCRGLIRLGVQCDEIWHSPLVRAVETAEIVSAEMKCGKLVCEQGLADEEEMEDLFESLGKLDREKDVFLVGHQPYLGEWLGLLLSGEEGCDVSVSKSGVARLDPIEGCIPPRAELKWLMRGKHLALLGQD